MPARGFTPRLPVLPFVVFASVCAVAMAQQAGLAPGTLVAATMGYRYPNTNPAGTGLFTVDPLARTSAPLSVANFPATPAEVPWHVHIESRLAFLVTTSVIQPSGSITGGAVYRVVASNGGFAATQLNATPMTEGVWACAPVGNSIYLATSATFSTGVPASNKLWRMPRAGGAVTMVADLAAMGVPGAGGGLTALGSTLHLFTFVSDSVSQAAGEHWAIATSVAPEHFTRVGPLPASSRAGTTGQQFGAMAASWDARLGAFAVLGVYGEVLWRDPVGNNVRRRALSGPPSQTGDYLAPAMAHDADNGTLYWGDKAGHVEQLRTPNARMQVDQLTLGTPSTAFDRFVMGLGYVPGAAAYLPDGPEGCPRITEWMTSCTNSRPAAGNANFALQLDTFASGAWLTIGLDNAQWNGNLLPFQLPGAPGCSVGTSADLATVFVTGSGGTLQFPLPLPLLAGTFYTQWAVFQPNANPLGVVLSDARRMEVR